MRERGAEIAVQRVAQEDPVLFPEGLVEPERRDGALDVLLVGLRIDQDIDRVADGEDAQENQKRHDKEHDYALHQAPNNENQHVRKLSFADDRPRRL